MTDAHAPEPQAVDARTRLDTYREALTLLASSHTTVAERKVALAVRDLFLQDAEAILTAEVARREQAERERDALQKSTLNRVCHDCGDVFEWSQVDDVGRCGRCYMRLVNGEPRLAVTAPHPDKRYVPASRLAALQSALEGLVEDYVKLLGDGVIVDTEPSVLAAARAALKAV